MEKYDEARVRLSNVEKNDILVLDAYCRLFEKSETYGQIIWLYKKIIDDSIGNWDFYTYLSGHLDTAITASEKALEYLRAFVEADIEADDFTQLQKLRYFYLEYDKNGLDGALRYFMQPSVVSDLKNKVYYYSTISYIAMKCGDIFLGLTNIMDIAYAGVIIGNIRAAHNDLVEIAMQFATMRTPNELNTAYWLSQLYECVLITVDDIEDDTKKLLFGKYIETTSLYMRGIFNPAMLNDENIMLLQVPFRFVHFMEKADDCRNRGDEFGYFKNMKTAFYHDERFELFVKWQTKLYKEEKEKKQDKTNELNALTRSLRSAIYKMIDAGKTEEAKKLIAQYEAINPTDEGIAGLKRRLVKLV
ncbi:MAG: hypothetical protein FWF03_04810 [Defluviitaleaceae bacterium]|nr:hypothetical protein [Defluviitaleaceae bacterium]